MKPFWALLKLNFKSLLLTSFNVGRSKKKAATGIGAMVFMAVLMLFISTCYSFSLGFGLSLLGGLDIMLMLMILVSMIMPLFMTIFMAQSLVFSTKDIDLVLSLPVSAFSVMLARVLALYLEILLMTELLLVPAGFAWALFGGSGGLLVPFLLFIIGIFLAFIPTTIGLLFGCLVSLFISRSRFKNLFNVIFSLLFVGLLFAGISQMNNIMTDTPMAADIEFFRSSLLGALPPLGWIVQAVTGSNLLWLPAIAIICIIPFLAVTWVFSKFYQTILTHLSSNRLKNDFKLKQLSRTGSFSALLAKEARRFFGTPVYLLNMGMFSFMLIALGVVAVVQKNRITQFIQEALAIVDSNLISTILPYMLLGLCVFGFSTTFISSVSISLEGKTLWILKSSPVSTNLIFAAKAGFNFLFDAIALVIMIPLFGYALSIPALQCVMIFLLVLLFCFFCSCAGLYINLLFPRLDAENETVVIKQSASGIVSMLVSLVVAALLAGMLVLSHFILPIGFIGGTFIACLILVALNLLSIYLLRTSGNQKFALL